MDSKSTKATLRANNVQAARIADVEIDFVPQWANDPKPTVAIALSEVGKLCSLARYGHGNASYVELHRRFQLLFETLKANESSGDVRSDLIDDYATAIEEFWRLLLVYDDMTFVERLLNLQHTRANLAAVNEQVERLFDKAGLNTGLNGDWAELNHKDMRTERRALEALANNAMAVWKALPDVRQKQDAIILLKAEMNNKESKLPPGSQDAVTKAYLALRNTGSIGDILQKIPPWFTRLTEVTYNAKPFGELVRVGSQ